MESADYQYMRLANELEQKIRLGRYRAGDKLPSLRAMRRQTGRSMSTVYHAYSELEQRGVVDVREKSGFYIRPLVSQVLQRPGIDRTIVEPHRVTINAMAELLQHTLANPDMLPFGTALPDPELLPRKQLSRAVRQAAGSYAGGELIGYCHPSGLKSLQTEIEKRMVGSYNSSQGDEVIITSGCLAAIDLCLRSVAASGDIILVESPTFLCYLQLIEDLNMRALEIPVDADTGIDLELLKEALDSHEVCAALLNANFHNPLGYVMEEGAKADLVKLFNSRHIPIIEDDIYGDLYFGETRPRPLKSFDQEGMVLYCSSFTKTLAPDLRVGWAVPGRYREKVKRLKFNSSVANNQLMQQAVADILASGAYERHLRKLRNALKKQLGAMLLAIADSFPEGTRASAPRGGLCLWVELEESIDTMDLFSRAREDNIAIVPGSLCSVTGNFTHCIRLNFGYQWSQSMEAGVARLGELIDEMQQLKTVLTRKST